MLKNFRRFALPKFPPTAAPKFKRLCVRAKPEDIPRLRQQLDQCVKEIEENIAKTPLLSLDTVQTLYARSCYLLDHYGDFKPHEQGLIIGAVRYFAIDEDGSSDSAFATGLDDDVQIMNYVLEKLGVTELYIE